MKEIEQTQCKDSILLSQIEKGNHLAFDVLFKKHWEKAFSDTYKRIKDYDGAKDIVQEIFTHIWVKRETLHIENLPAYLNISIKNRVIKYIAQQKLSHPYFSFLDHLPEKHSEADGNLLLQEFFTSFEKLLNTLPPKRQAIFRLRFEENLSTKVISMKLGINRKTVQNQLGMAIQTVRVSLMRILSIFIFLL